MSIDPIHIQDSERMRLTAQPIAGTQGTFVHVSGLRGARLSGPQTIALRDYLTDIINEWQDDS